MNIRSLIPWRDKSQISAMRDDIYDPFVAFRREFNRLMDDFFTPGMDGRGLAPMNGDWHVGAPAVDISETDTELLVTAEMPGLDEKDFEVTVSGDLLTIKGEKKSENEEKTGNGYYRERRYGAFTRSLRLPFEVTDEKVDATYKKGVLTIRLPKPAEAQKPVRQITVKAA
jgi:HSP20 family protein